MALSERCLVERLFLAASEPRRFEEGSDDALLCFFGERRPARQAEPAVKQVRCHGTSNHATILIHRLQMHRFPNGTRLDVVGL